MRVYKYDSAIYARKITFIGIFCGIALAYAVIQVLMGGNPAIFMGVGAIALYTVWETFISFSNPDKVMVSGESITFCAYGKEHRYLWKDVTQFKAKEFTGARKLFIRINQPGLFRGRYWLHCYYFNDTDELYNLMVEKECELHPDSIKAWARNGSKVAS